MSIAVVSLKIESVFGKSPATRVRRLICVLSVSQALEVRRRFRLCSGRAKIWSPSGIARHSLPSYRLAQSKGLSTLFSGFGGDEFVTQRAPQYLRHCYENRLTVPLIRETFYSPSIEGWWPKSKYVLRYFAERMGGRQKYAPMQSSGNHWIRGQEEICGLLSLEGQTTFKELCTPLNICSPFDMNAWQVIALSESKLHRVVSEQTVLAEAFGLNYRYPLLDLRVLRVALGMPSSLWVRRGVNRYPFRQAMRGILPESIRTRNDKAGPSLPAVSVLLEREFEDMKERLLTYLKSEIVKHYFDTNAVESYIQKIDLKAENLQKRQARTVFVNFFAVAYFLESL
jgi:asparagine synthase (glutamine-hydrolysing)